MHAAPRVEPDSGSGVRARNVGQPATSRADKRNSQNDYDDDEDRRETICTLIVNELDPRSIIQWPRLFIKSILRTLQVFATIRFIRVGDVIGGLVNSALLFTFAAVFSSAIFGEVGLTEYVALGTGCSLITTIILQSAFTIFSDVGINMAGPDVNPAIFTATMAGLARQSMIRRLEEDASKHTDSPTTSPASHPSARLLAGHGTPSPTINAIVDNQVDPESLLATVLAIIIMSTVLFGTFVYVLGRLKVSRGVQLVPGSVLAGFMASIGYLVIVKALKTAIPHEAWEEGPGAWDFWMFFLPSIPIGVLMYLQKRWHVGSPVVLLPIILTVPLIIFFAVTYGTGSDVEKARGEGWLFPAYDSEVFYNQFVDSYGHTDKVDWVAISAAIPTMLVMMFIVTVDSLLKQASIRKLLKAHDLRIDHELMLMGKANVVAGLLVGICGYPQPKLVAINYGVLRNTTSRVSGIIVIVSHAILFFFSFPLINYLPRFWLAGVLIFAAAGFIVENLWDSRLKFSRKEYLSIWAIVVINALFGLAWAVLAGVVLSALIFAMAYSRGGAIKAIISGSEFRSSVVRPSQDDMKLEHVGSKAVIIQLHRYVFFGSAAYVNEVIVGLIKEQDTMVTEEKRAVYFIFDWAHVEDVDVTSMDVVTEMLSKLLNVETSNEATHGHDNHHHNNNNGGAIAGHTEPKRIVLFTGLKPGLRKKLAGENIIQLLHEPEYRGLAGSSLSSIEDAEKGITGKHRRCFDTLDRGMEFVEERLLQWSWEVRKRWFRFDSFRDFHLRARIMIARQSFEHVLLKQLGQEIWRFVEPIDVPKGWTLCRAGEIDSHLYLVREGSLTAYIENESASDPNKMDTSRLQTLGQGAFINEDAVYIDRPIVPYTVVADEDSVVLALSRENMARLDNSYPAIAIEVHRKVLRHAARTKHKIVRMLASLNLWDKEETANSDSTTTRALGEVNGTTGMGESLLASANSPEAANVLGGGARVDGLATSTTNNEAAVGLLGSITNTTIGAIQGATATTLGAIQGVTTGVAHTTVAVLQNTLIVSGFREDEDENGNKDLLDTAQLRDGAGEKSGRRLAQQFAGKQRRTRALSTAAAALGEDGNPDESFTGGTGSGKAVMALSQKKIAEIKTVRQFRAFKLGAVGEDGDDAASAIYRLVNSNGRLIDADVSSMVNLPASIDLRLNEAQLVNSKSVFSKFVGEYLPRAPRGPSATMSSSSSSSNLEMPRAKVRQALAQLGLTIPSTDEEFADENDPIPLTESDFIRVATRLSFAALSADFFQRAAELFVSLVQDIDGFLTESSLAGFLANSPAIDIHDIAPGSVGRFIQKWSIAGQEGVDFSGFCSALAQYAKTEQEDEQVEADWRQLSGGEDSVRAEDIARVFGCTITQAQEMVWEADYDNNGVLNFYDLLDTLTTLREGSSSWLGGGPSSNIIHTVTTTSIGAAASAANGGGGISI